MLQQLTTAKEAIWLQQLISEIISPFKQPTPIFCNNNGTWLLAKDSAVFYPRTKHINI
jgi:hypothetical protein